MLKLTGFHTIFFFLLCRQFYIYNNSMSVDFKPAEEIMSPKISVTDFPKEKLQLKKLSSDENCLLTSQKLAASASVKEVS